MLLTRHTDKLYEVGVDEVGRGCGAGDVVAAAVILPSDYHNSDIKDSKKLSAKKREQLYDIIQNVAIDYAIASCSVSEIESLNILQASQLAMRKAILKLKKVDHLIIDGNYWIDELRIPYDTIVKGDGKYLSIAAASILAKVHRDRNMDKLALDFPIYEWQKNKGYLTAKHIKAIKEHGTTIHHRLSFIHV